MKKPSLIFYIIIILFSVSAISFPQSKAKADKTIQVITKLIEKCQNTDWMLYDILFDGMPYKEYNTPFNENSNKNIEHSLFSKRDQYFKGEFGIDPRSDLSKKLIEPLDNEFIRMSSENPEPQDSMNAISIKQREIGVVYVYVFINKKAVEGNQFTDEKNPDAALVTKINHAFRDSCNWDSYFLAFGNWKNAEHDSKGYTFKFKHYSGTPYIDNFVVVLTGVKSRVIELMRKINWDVLNKAITE
jgi:hypothetical protein